MIRVALVEDDSEYKQQFLSYLTKYGLEKGIEVQTEYFSDGLSFIQNYHKGYDIVLMDIEMPRLNGIDASKQLRKIDSEVCLIFITTFEVNALDFLVKPVSYELFDLKMDKARNYLQKTQSEIYILKMPGETYKIQQMDILYVESQDHYLIFHVHGKKEEYRIRGKLRDISLQEDRFCLIGRSLLVNLAYVEEINDLSLTVAGEVLPLARAYKTILMKKLTTFWGEA